MTDLPGDRQYTAEHEWVLEVTPGSWRIGITDFAQSSLGDVVFLDLPSSGTRVAAGDSIGEVESTKSVSDLYAPISGTVVEVNQAVLDDPSLTNRDPYGAGWLIVVSGDANDSLMSGDEYRSLIAP